MSRSCSHCSAKSVTSVSARGSASILRTSASRRCGLAEPARDAGIAQRVVRNAVPEEQREPRREHGAVVLIAGCGRPRVLGHAVIQQELGAAQDSREAHLDAGLEVAAVVAAARVELAQGLAILIVERPAVGAQREAAEDLVGACGIAHASRSAGT